MKAARASHDPPSPSARSPPSPKSSSRVSVSDLVAPDESSQQVERLTRQLNDLQATLLANRTSPEAVGEGADARVAPSRCMASSPSTSRVRKVRSLSPTRQVQPPSRVDHQGGSTVVALDLAHRDWISEEVLGFGLTPALGRRRDGRGMEGVTTASVRQNDGFQEGVGDGGEEPQDPRVEAMKDHLFLELKRRLPTERAIDFLDHMKKLNDQTISYQEAWNEAYALLGPLNMDIFHAFLKVLYGSSKHGTAR